MPDSVLQKTEVGYNNQTSQNHAQRKGVVHKEPAGSGQNQEDDPIPSFNYTVCSIPVSHFRSLFLDFLDQGEKVFERSHYAETKKDKK